MSTRAFRLPRRRLVVAALAISAIVVVVAVVFVTSLSFGARIAHGGGTGGGGCTSSTGPACHFTSNDASVAFGTTASDGCTVTQVFLSSFQSLSRPGATTSSSVVVSISKFNTCTNILLENASNFDPTTGAPDFTGTAQFGGNLDTATVTGTAPMFDTSTGMPGPLLFTASINVTWQGFGPTTKNIDSTHTHQPGFIFNSHFNGTNRAATASGTFTDETGANVAAPTLDAELDNAQNGTVLIFQS